jgi:hypothetical protein
VGHTQRVEACPEALDGAAGVRHGGSLKKEVEEGYSTVNRRICEPAEWLTATVDVTVAQP